MNSIWAEAVAVFKKDLRIELRNRTGFWTASLYAVAVMSAIGFATTKERPGPELSSGILTAVLLITALSALPRVLLTEDEMGTFDLLRLRFSPEGIYWGKWMYIVALQIANALVLGGLFLLFTGTEVVRFEYFFLGLILESLSVSSAVVICGAVVMGATHRWLVVGVLALPLLLPQSAGCVGLLRYSFGAGLPGTALINALALGGYALVAVFCGPLLARGLWKRD